mgnify:CR=1 FL=1
MKTNDLFNCYPAAAFRQDDGTVEWIDEAGDALIELDNREMLKISEGSYNGEYANALCWHCRRIVADTIDALRQIDDERALEEVIDAAARKGSAFAGGNSAGHFLEVIARLAMQQIKQGGADNG